MNPEIMRGLLFDFEAQS